MYDLVTVESFDLEKTYEYILSIQVRLDGFSFSIYNPEEKKILAFKSNSLNISNSKLIERRFKEWYKGEELLHHPYKKTRLIVFNKNFSLVPVTYYENHSKEDFARILFHNSSRLEYGENLVEDLNAKLLFALPEGLNKTIAKTIGECDILHPIKQLIKYLLANKPQPSLALLFEKQHIYLVAVQNGNILLTNTFKVNHINDILYYTLTALKQLNINPKATTLFCTGNSEYTTEAMLQLTNRFKKLVNIHPDYTIDNNTDSEDFLVNNALLFL